MAIIEGTSGADRILLDSLSAGVTTDSAEPGTLTGASNVIDAGAGDDVVEAGDSGDDVHGGTGADRITGNVGSDWLRGDAGSDLLIGGAGFFDVLDGGVGADRMLGGDGLDYYVVDSYADVVFDDGTTPDDAFDVIVTNLNYTLSERAGVEGLELGGEIFGVGAKPWTVYGGGNSRDNFIYGNANANVLNGKGGTDLVQGLEGNDLVLGGAGADDVSGWEGRDVVRGQNGDDYSVWGGADQDRLIGGRGNDTIFFNYVSESVPGAADVITCGDGAVAFENPGTAAGDLIWLPNALSPETASEALGPFTFGGTGRNEVSCINSGRDTLVRASVDDDPGFEFVIRIADGAVRAKAYTADDFFLG